MTKIFTSKEDEILIGKIIHRGLEGADSPKWATIRLALAISLHIPTEPDPNLDHAARGTEYDLKQVSWLGGEKKGEPYPVSGNRTDYTDAYKALLSAYHEEDLFKNEDNFRLYLQRHIRRGFREIRTSWRENHDFFEFLYQELFSDVAREESTVAEEPSGQLMTALSEIGVRGEVRETLTGPRVTRVLVHLPDVYDLDRTRRGLDKITFSLGLRDKGVFMESTDSPKVVALDIPRPQDTWKKITGADMRQWFGKEPEGFGLPVWPGVDVLGNPHVVDLAKAPHLLVAGTTGSGKSVCLHALIVSLLANTDSKCQLCLIDPKKVEFFYYAKLPMLFGGQVHDGSRKTLQILEALNDEMEERVDILSKSGFRDLEQARSSGKCDLAPIVVFVEELADLFSQVPESEDLLVRLAQKARASGIHLVLSTQRPDAKTFSGQLRSNIPARIALTVQKATESKIILDETGAERLSGAGDMLVKESGKETVRIHGVFVGPDDISKAVNQTRGYA